MSEILQWLKGSRNIVLRELSNMLDDGEPVSIRRLADRVPYSERTVHSALKDLRSLGLVSMEWPGPGHAATYCVHEEECVWFK